MVNRRFSTERKGKGQDGEGRPFYFEGKRGKNESMAGLQYGKGQETGPVKTERRIA